VDGASEWPNGRVSWYVALSPPSPYLCCAVSIALCHSLVAIAS